MIDRDEDGHPDPQPFYAVGTPCESCGMPVNERRWDAKAELWIGTDCPCNVPYEPICEALCLLLARCETVGEVCDTIKMHKGSCAICSGAKKPAGKETKLGAKEDAA